MAGFVWVESAGDNDMSQTEQTPRVDGKTSVGSADERTITCVGEGLADRMAKAFYSPPRLRVYGSVADFTKGGLGSEPDGFGGKQQKKPSDPALKENILRIGDHPLGIGIYLFEYRAEFRDACGHGRQFGVMMDEVERVMPEAVSVGPDGYRSVDYTQLGIVLPH
jgi:hypothetical protein